MRIGAPALALCVAAAEGTGPAASGARRDASSFLARRPSSSWGVVALVPNGGDASPFSPDAEDNVDVDAEEKNDGSTSAFVVGSASSHILKSVSGGGGCLPADRSDVAAFVGAARRTSPATSSTLGRRPLGAADSGSSLSVATDQLKSSDAIESAPTSEDESNSTETRTMTAARNQNKGPPLKILFLSSDTGGGHRASAEALANQFQRLFPGTTYDLMDVWTDVDSSWPYNTIKDTYKSFSATPWKWRALYYVSNTRVHAKIADWHSWYMNEELIREKMEEYDPDVVVSVHPTMNYVPLLSIRKISKKVGRDIPFFTVVTDFGSGHCTWFNRDVDKMYLASDPIKKIARDRGGVPNEKIVMSGLPIRYDFASQADAMGDRTTERGKAHQAKVRKQLGIVTNKKMVLVMGGGEGVGSLSDIVNELYAKLRTQGVDATICVVCGRNEQLKADLETRCWDTVVSQSLQSYESLKSRFFTKIFSPHAHRSRRIQMALDRAAARAARGNDVAEIPGIVDVVPLGFVRNMADYMVAADVLVSKAGPGTIAEAASVGLPIMVTSHLPGQEAGNVDIVLEGGFGDFCEDPETIGLEVACWLREPQLLDLMSQKAMKVGHPHAAEEIALDIGVMTHRWMEANMLKIQSEDSNQ